MPFRRRLTYAVFLRADEQHILYLPRMRISFRLAAAADGGAAEPAQSKRPPWAEEREREVTPLRENPVVSRQNTT